MHGTHRIYNITLQVIVADAFIIGGCYARIKEPDAKSSLFSLRSH